MDGATEPALEGNFGPPA